MSMMRAALLGALLWASVVNAAPRDELSNAVSIDNVRDTSRLVEQGVDANAPDARGDTALIAAIRDDAKRVIDYLIASPKVDLDRTNASLETAMMIAAFRNRPDVVAKLIERGAQVNRRGWTALHYAAAAGDAESVKILLEHYAYIDAESPNKTTPLMMAARSNHAEIVHLLIDEGADPTPINERDLAAADFARRAGDDDLARWLDQQMQRHGVQNTGMSRSPSPDLGTCR